MGASQQHLRWLWAGPPAAQGSFGKTLFTAEKAAEAEKAAAEKEAVLRKVAAEKAVVEKLAAEKVAAEKAAEKLLAEKLVAEKLLAEKVAAEKAAEKILAEKVAAEKIEAQKLAVEKETEKQPARKATTEQTLLETAAREIGRFVLMGNVLQCLPYQHDSEGIDNNRNKGYSRAFTITCICMPLTNKPLNHACNDKG